MWKVMLNSIKIFVLLLNKVSHYIIHAALLSLEDILKTRNTFEGFHDVFFSSFFTLVQSSYYNCSVRVEEKRLKENWGLKAILRARTVKRNEFLSNYNFLPSQKNKIHIYFIGFELCFFSPSVQILLKWRIKHNERIIIGNFIHPSNFPGASRTPLYKSFKKYQLCHDGFCHQKERGREILNV